MKRIFVFLTLFCASCSQQNKAPEIALVEQFQANVNYLNFDVISKTCTSKTQEWLKEKCGNVELENCLMIRSDWQFDRIHREAVKLVSPGVVHGSLAGRPWQFVIQNENGQPRIDLIASGPLTENPGQQQGVE